MQLPIPYCVSHIDTSLLYQHYFKFHASAIIARPNGSNLPMSVANSWQLINIHEPICRPRGIVETMHYATHSLCTKPYNAVIDSHSLCTIPYNAVIDSHSLCTIPYNAVIDYEHSLCTIPYNAVIDSHSKAMHHLFVILNMYQKIEFLNMCLT